jgi:membrane protein implicated in regulation of membrane protease activity
MMEDHWWWAIVGIALVIAELITGTFYLLVIGIAALAGAAVAYAHYSFWTQAIVAAIVALIGVILVTRFRKIQVASPNVSLDIGQSVVLDAWVNERERRARVRYRNALWDAKVLDAQGAEAGRTLYIRDIVGNLLHVSTQPPA